MKQHDVIFMMKVSIIYYTIMLLLMSLIVIHQQNLVNHYCILANVEIEAANSLYAPNTTSQDFKIGDFIIDYPRLETLKCPGKFPGLGWLD
jgi:hypothetical protein